LKDKWSPAWSLESVCRAILDLLSNPYADSPLNCDCGNLIRCEDFIGYNSLAKMYTIEYATTKRVQSKRLGIGLLKYPPALFTIQRIYSIRM